MKKKVYCTVCHSVFYPMRSSAKYCSEACKQRAKYKREHNQPMGNFYTDLSDIENKLNRFKADYFDQEIDPEVILQNIDALNNAIHIVNKMQAIAMTIEMKADNQWYECLNCGQKSFGRVDKCDFCSQSDFKPIAPIN